jgi:hypothetical protein
MTPALRHLLACALLLAAGVVCAQAQADEVLERYELALTNLSESMASLDSDVTASRDELDRAAGALRFLAAQAGSPGLVESMERVFERARTAIQNRSRTDLGVQSSLLRGGFQRALFDSALSAMGSDRATALARLERLATDLGLDADTRAALAAVSDAASARVLIEAAVAQQVRGQLQLTVERFPTNRDAAYLVLADAYGDFLLVQDSPRADSRLNEAFAGAAEALVAGNGEELSARLSRLGQSFQQLAEAAHPVPDEQPADEGPAGETSGTAAPAGAGTPEAQRAPSEPAAPAPASTSAAVAERQQAVATAPVAAPPTVAASQPTAAAGAAVAQPSEVRAAPAGAVETPRGTASSEEEGGTVAATTRAAGTEADPAESERARRALERELVLAGVPGARVARLATDLLGRGVASLADATSGVYASVGRLVAALQSGDGDAAVRHLGEASAAYTGSLRPLVTLLSPAVDGRMERLLESMASTPVLRTQDALVLLGQVEAIDRLLAGKPASRVQIADGETTIVWSGWPRLAALLVLALLAVIPLYLLNLAFGGGNRNWQLIGVALFLLLLPAIYEGVATLAAFVAELVDLPVLAVGTSFSMFQSPLGQVAWVGLTLAGILFAAAGLHGICVQFGLLGSGRATTGDSQTMISTAAVGDADTIVDWDEEF